MSENYEKAGAPVFSIGDRVVSAGDGVVRRVIGYALEGGGLSWMYWVVSAEVGSFVSNAVHVPGESLEGLGDYVRRVEGTVEVVAKPAEGEVEGGGEGEGVEE